MNIDYFFCQNSIESILIIKLVFTYNFPETFYWRNIIWKRFRSLAFEPEQNRYIIKNTPRSSQYWELEWIRKINNKPEVYEASIWYIYKQLDLKGIHTREKRQCRPGINRDPFLFLCLLRVKVIGDHPRGMAWYFCF